MYVTIHEPLKQPVLRKDRKKKELAIRDYISQNISASTPTLPSSGSRAFIIFTGVSSPAFLIYPAPVDEKYEQANAEVVEYFRRFGGE
jgi:hypothetical protein